MKSIKVLLVTGLIWSSTLFVFAEDKEKPVVDLNENISSNISSQNLDDSDEIVEKFSNLFQEVLHSNKPSLTKRTSLMVLRETLRICAVALTVPNALSGNGELFLVDILALIILLSADSLVHSNDNVLASLQKLDEKIKDLTPKEKKKIRTLFSKKYAGMFFEKFADGKEGDGIIVGTARAGTFVFDLITAIAFAFVPGFISKSNNFGLSRVGALDLILVVLNLYNHPNREKERVFARIKESLA